MAYENLSLAAVGMERYLKASGNIQYHVHANIRKLTMDVAETLEILSPLHVQDSDRDPHTTIDDSWCDRMQKSLVCFARSHLKRMTRIDRLKLRISVHLSSEYAQGRLLNSSIMEVLACMPQNNISRLTLDYGGDPLPLMGTPEQVTGCHCYHLLAKHFPPSVRHVRVRGRRLCPEFLEYICSHDDPQVESLIINLSVRVQQTTPQPMDKIFFSHSCHWSYDGEDQRTHLIDGARSQIPQLPRIKVLRILQHTHVLGEDVTSYDVLSDKSVILPLGADWEDPSSADGGEPDPAYEECSNNSFSKPDSDGGCW